MLSAVGELRIDLVRNHKEVMGEHHLADRLQIRLFHDGARRVIRKRDEKHFCPPCDLLLQFLRRQTESVLRLQWNRYRNSPAQLHAGNVGHIGGFNHQHFVSRIHQRTQRQINPLACTHCNKDLIRPVIVQIELFQILRCRRTQLHGTAVVGVLRLGAPDGGDRRLPDMLRRLEVRLPDAKRQSPVHGICNIEKILNTGIRHLHNNF